MVSCCRYCDKREVGCHSTCEEYLKQAQAQKELNEVKWKEKHTYDDHKARIDKFYKTRNRRGKQ